MDIHNLAQIQLRDFLKIIQRPINLMLTVKDPNHGQPSDARGLGVVSSYEMAHEQEVCCNANTTTHKEYLVELVNRRLSAVWSIDDDSWMVTH